MSDYQVSGGIIQIYPAQTFGTFTKREFVVKTEDEYPQSLKFEFYNEKCEVLDAFNLNDRVTVKFRIRGSATKDGQRYFVNLSAWQLDRLATGAVAPADDEPPMPEAPGGDDTEMPF